MGIVLPKASPEHEYTLGTWDGIVSLIMNRRCPRESLVSLLTCTQAHQGITSSFLNDK